MSQNLLINFYDDNGNRLLNILDNSAGYTEGAISIVNKLVYEYATLCNKCKEINYFELLIEALHNLGMSYETEEDKMNYNDWLSEGTIDLVLTKEGTIYCEFFGVGGCNYIFNYALNGEFNHYDEFNKIILNSNKSNIVETINALNNIGIHVCNSENFITPIGIEEPLCELFNNGIKTSKLRIDYNLHSKAKRSDDLYVSLPEIINTTKEEKIGFIYLFQSIL